MPKPTVVYASAGWGIHDRRWAAALAACGFRVTVLNEPTGLREAVAACEPRSAPVLAGPLGTVTRDLIGLQRPLVGLSWGFDLQPGHSRSTPLADLSWLHRLDRLIVDSPSTASVAESLGMPPERIYLLPWGVDLESFTLAGGVRPHGFPEDSRVILSLRTHEDLYRTGDVIEAFVTATRSDPRLHLLMGGSGTLTEEHRRRLAASGVAERVAFLGQVPEDLLPALLRSADLYVSASETDGTSVTLLQAMACGVPVATSDIPGNRWWVEEGRTGRLFDLGDTDALAALMCGEDTPDPLAMAQAARAQVAERADWRANRLALRHIMYP